MCDCIEKVQKSLTDMMVHHHPGCEVVEPVKFQNISWVFEKDGTALEFLGVPILGKYSIKGKTKKWEISMLPEFCPLCGKRYKEKSEGNE